MRKARYDLRKVNCPNASFIGYSKADAKPGDWILWRGPVGMDVGRVLGRVAECASGPQIPDATGWLAAVRLGSNLRHAHVMWVNPALVHECYAPQHMPANLLAWITSPDWVHDKGDIARIVAMSEHGTLCEQFIERRHDPKAAYNARPEYVNQFILP